MEQVPVTKTCIKCNETKVFELFEKDKRTTDGRRNVCRKCRIKANSLLKKSKKVDKPKKPYLNHTEPPPTMTCKKCGEVKESRFFIKDKYKKFGIRGTCKECEKIKWKNCYVKRKEKEEKLLKGNASIDELTRTCHQCNKTKSLALFTKKICAELGRSRYCKECNCKREKLWIQSKPGLYKEQRKESYKKAAETLSKSYLKSIFRTNFKVPTKDITDEQLQLQKESILLHREYKQLKLFYETST